MSVGLVGCCEFLCVLGSLVFLGLRFGVCCLVVM